MSLDSVAILSLLHRLSLDEEQFRASGQTVYASDCREAIHTIETLREKVARLSTQVSLYVDLV